MSALFTTPLASVVTSQGWGRGGATKEPLRDGGSAGPARADPADGRGRGPAGKGKLPAVWGRAAAGGAFEPADLAGGADRSRRLAQGLGWLLKKQ